MKKIEGTGYCSVVGYCSLLVLMILFGTSLVALGYEVCEKNGFDNTGVIGRVYLTISSITPLAVLAISANLIGRAYKTGLQDGLGSPIPATDELKIGELLEVECVVSGNNNGYNGSMVLVNRYPFDRNTPFLILIDEKLRATDSNALCWNELTTGFKYVWTGRSLQSVVKVP